MQNIKFISAGAGSGKTYTLTEELYNKIAQKKYVPSEIVLTTFTKAAANEFRERSRAKLIEKGNLAEADLLAGATIGTVHSVCLSFLKKYWYRNGSTVIPQEISDSEKDAYISRSLLSVVNDTDIALFNDYRDEFDINDTNNQKDYSWWKATLDSIIKTSETFGVNDFTDSRKESHQLIDTLFNTTHNPLDNNDFTTLKDYFNFCENSTTGAAKTHIKELTLILNKKPQDLKYFEVSKLYSILSDLADKRNLKKNPTLSESLGTLLQKISDLRSSCHYGSKIKGVVDLLFDLALAWKGVYANYKKENGLIDYNDMELQFLELLDDAKVVEEIKGNIKLVLVDEFQDCNQTQIKIFEKLSTIAQESIWVGDSKQAIYGFRGSDTDLTNAMICNFANIQPGTQTSNGLSFDKLEYSYRSVPEIVNFVNDLFIPTFGQYGLSRDMVELKANRVNEKGSVECWRTTEKNQANRSAQVAQKIKDLINDGKKPGDIAILTRKNDQYTDYAEPLTKLGIPVNMGNTNLCDYAEVQMVVAVMKYILNDNNDLAKAEIMRLFTKQLSGTIITDYKIYRTTNNGKWIPDEDLFKKIDYAANQVKTQSVSNAVRSIITLLSLRRRCEQWGNAIARKSNIDRLISIAQQYEQENLNAGRAASLNDFLFMLTSGEVTDDRTDVSSNAEGVTICTYHKAKGLQWDTVILDNLYDESYKKQDLAKRNVIGVHANRTQLPTPENLYVSSYITCVPRFLSSPMSNLPDEMIAILLNNPSGRNVLGEIEDKMKQENNRLYYVGMTRAKDHLVVLSKDGNDTFASINPIIPNSEKKKLGERIEQKEELPPLSEDGNAPQTYQQMSDSLGNGANTGEKYISPSLHKDGSSNVTITTVWHTNKVAPNKHLIEMTQVNNTANMTAAGSCIHNIFAAYRPEATDAENLAMAEKIVKASSLDSCFSNVSQIIESVKEVYAYLTQTYGAGKAMKEIPFSMEENGAIYSGEIDLVWALDNNECVLVDYKSYPGFDLVDHAKNYTGQLSLYKKALEKAGFTLKDALIYFNAHGAFVEVEM